jgi:hypothetical protein
MPRKLRAVEPGEKPERVLTVAEAAALNDHRGLLVSLQARIARSVESANCPPVALAALSRQLVSISKELSVLDAVADADPIGEAARVPDALWTGTEI